MKENISITLGDYYDTFISKEIESGRYSSASEVIKSALRLLETEERKKELLVEALVIGEMSEPIENFDATLHLQKLHERLS